MNGNEDKATGPIIITEHNIEDSQHLIQTRQCVGPLNRKMMRNNRSCALGVYGQPQPTP